MKTRLIDKLRKIDADMARLKEKIEENRRREILEQDAEEKAVIDTACDEMRAGDDDCDPDDYEPDEGPCHPRFTHFPHWVTMANGQKIDMNTQGT